MTQSTKRDLVAALLDRYPRTYAEQLHIGRLDKPSGLFQLLVMALLMSARIRASVAFDAAAALFEQGWKTPAKMADATWEERTRTLNRAGYARYDERTSTMLADTSQLLIEAYHGDLRRLREEAGREPKAERELLDQFKGIGNVGVDIFFREVQIAWPELYPFADSRALDTAKDLGLGSTARALAAHADDRRDLVRLVSALVQVRLDHGEGDLREAVRARV
jgi:endonuclease III